MKLLSFVLKSILSSFTAIIVFSYQDIASPKPEFATPVCYMTLASGRTMDLSQLCGKTFREANDNTNSLINREQNAGENITSDAPGDEMKRIEFAQDKDAAINDLFNRLNYSHKTRALLKQAEALQQQLFQTEDVAEKLQIIRQFQNLEQQMMQDPNYVGVDEVLPMTNTP